MKILSETSGKNTYIPITCHVKLENPTLPFQGPNSLMSREQQHKTKV